MEVFKPFLGQNYFNKYEKSNNFSRFVCPYNFDVESYEKSLIFKKNDHNVFNFKDDKKGRSNFKSWVEGSVLVPSKNPTFYIYEMSYKIAGVLYSLKGIVGILKLPEKGEDYVLTCAETDENDVEKVFGFLKNSGFYSSPVCAFVDCKDSSKFLNLVKGKMISSYVFKAKQDNVVHKIWKIEDVESVNFLLDFFKNRVYYIFSGVEKYEASIRYRDFLRKNFDSAREDKEDYILTLAFLKNDFSFTALPYHRLVSGLFMFDGKEILKKVSEYFNIVSCKTLDSMRSTLFNCRREEKVSFGFYADGCYSVFVLKNVEEVKKSFKNEEDSDEKFDIFVLNRILLGKILNVGPEQVSYSVVDKMATKSVDEGNACFCIYLNAIRSCEFFSVIKSNKKLPKRSYCFFPNPVEGLLFYALD